MYEMSSDTEKAERAREKIERAEAKVRERSERAPAFFTALASVSQGRMVPVPGGVLIRSVEGDIVGAVGISGDHPDHDEACAVHGIALAQLVADPGEAG